MKHLAVAFLALVVAGCAPAYTIKQLDNRFSESENDMFVAEGNRISKKSMAGGTHIDETGLQINPAAEVDADGNVASLYLSLVNVTNRDSRLGAPNSIGTPQRIAFLVDGDLLTVELSGERRYADVIHSNAQTRDASIGIREVGVGLISPEHFLSIVDAETLAVRVEGSRRSHTYEAGDIESSFRNNLRAFAEQFGL